MPDPIRFVKMIAMDVDGVLTDGIIYQGAKGEEMRGYHVHDGQGISLAKRAGLIVAVITTKESRSVEDKAKELQVSEIHQGKRKKWASIRELIEKHKLRPEEVCYIGDDIADVPVMKRVGFPIAVANATSEAKRVARYVTKNPGGRGAIREVIELILSKQEKLKDVLLECYAELEVGGEQKYERIQER